MHCFYLDQNSVLLTENLGHALPSLTHLVHRNHKDDVRKLMALYAAAITDLDDAIGAQLPVLMGSVCDGRCTRTWGCA